MEASQGEVVSVQIAMPRAIAAVRARLPIGRIPAVFAEYLNQVYAAAREGTIEVDGQNIFVYRGGAGGEDVDVEFGVGTAAPFAATGEVRYSTLPAGEVATATHWGDYARLGNAHAAVIDWCQRHGRKRAGPRWEIYGHWNDDPARRRTDVYYLLEASS